MEKADYGSEAKDKFRSQADKNKIAVKNMTKKEKLKHFWFYYRLHTFGAIFALLLIAFTLQQCATRVNPDISIIVMTDKNVIPTDEQQKAIDYFSSITKDVNGDGKKSADIQFLSLGSDQDPQLVQAMTVKLFAAMSDSNTIIYITDETEFNQYKSEDIFDNIINFIPDAKGVTQYKLPVEDINLASSSFGKYMSGLSVTIRKYKGTAIDKPANLPYYENSINVLKKLATQ